MCFLIIFTLSGCIAPRVQPPDENIEPIIAPWDEDTESIISASDDNRESIIPPWDERIEIDPVDPDESMSPEGTNISVTPEDNTESVMEALAEDNTGYHFRKTKWGFNRQRVELAEVGNTVVKRTPQTLVYKCKINGVNCHLIYTFEKNKLRTAGYITAAPIPNADNLTKAVVDKYGPPDGQETYEGGPNEGLREMIWTTPHTVIFSNLYPTVTKQTLTAYDRTDGGLLKGLIEKQRAETRSGDIVYYTGVHAHIDKAFFYKLQELRYPLDELSSYEKQLMGATVRGRRTIIPGLGTIPR